MKKISSLIIIGAILVGLVVVLPQCYERIPAGYAGIRENLYGSERGVDDVTEVSGMVWYNPLLTRIHKFPKFIQNIVFTRDITEGSPENEEVRVKKEFVQALQPSFSERIGSFVRQLF